MDRRDDVNKLYLPSQQLGKACEWIFWLNCVLSVISLFALGKMYNLLMVLQIATAMLYVIIGIIDDGIFWYNAESERRKNSIQNAFDIRVSELETEAYYNNSLSPSVLKYALNTFESNYFSKYIAAKMLNKSTVKTVAALLLLVSLGWMVADGNIVQIAAQAVFSAYIIEDTVLLAVYTSRLNKLYDEAYHEIVTVGIHSRPQVVLMLLYAVEYESIKAHYKVRLDSKLFLRYNQELSEKWNEITAHINIAVDETERKI